MRMFTLSHFILPWVSEETELLKTVGTVKTLGTLGDGLDDLD
jgi:hypothetical protein